MTALRGLSLEPCLKVTSSCFSCYQMGDAFVSFDGDRLGFVIRTITIAKLLSVFSVRPDFGLFERRDQAFLIMQP